MSFFSCQNNNFCYYFHHLNVVVVINLGEFSKWQEDCWTAVSVTSVEGSRNFGQLWQHRISVMPAWICSEEPPKTNEGGYDILIFLARVYGVGGAPTASTFGRRSSTPFVCSLFSGHQPIYSLLCTTTTGQGALLLGGTF